MMYTHLNTIFVVLALVVFMYMGWRKASVYSFIITLLILFALTAIFDNLIIMSGIVTYDNATLMGLFIGAAPVEDFDYTFVAVILLPTLWHFFKDKERKT